MTITVKILDSSAKILERNTKILDTRVSYQSSADRYYQTH